MLIMNKSISRQIEAQISDEIDPFIPPAKFDKVMEVIQGAALGRIQTAIVDDIGAMIDKNQRYSIDGYILCLSRMISHEIAWSGVQEAYQAKNQTVPPKYAKLFTTNATIPNIRISE